MDVTWLGGSEWSSEVLSTPEAQDNTPPAPSSPSEGALPLVSASHLHR